MKVCWAFQNKDHDNGIVGQEDSCVLRETCQLKEAMAEGKLLHQPTCLKYKKTKMTLKRLEWQV